MAQLNLVPNPGFEYNLSSIPNTGYNQYKNVGFPLTYGWQQPTEGTSDFWNSPYCRVRIKKNGWVMQVPPARTGWAHAGLLLNSHRKWNSDRKAYGEYLQARLLGPLETGKKYYFECYVMLARKSRWSTSNIGVYFSENAVKKNANTYLELQPQVVCDQQLILSKRGEWQKISGFFTAKGDEKYLTIGTFVYPGACISEKKLSENGEPGDKSLEQIAYYYFDDFLLIEDSDAVLAKTKSPDDHVTMLVDISGSMYKEKYVEALKQTVAHFISAQGANTKITLVTFGSGIKQRAVAKQFNDTITWNAVMSSFGPSGGTNIARAIGRGFELADSLKKPEGRNRVILFTDAKFDLDKQTQRLIRQHIGKSEVEFDLYQFGSFYNKTLDKTMRQSGGNYHTSNTKKLEELLVEKNACDCGKQFERRLKWGSWRYQRGIAAAATITVALGTLIFLNAKD